MGGNRNASFVIEKVLTHCAAAQQQVLVQALLAGGSDLLAQMGRSRLAPHFLKASSMLADQMPHKAFSDMQLSTGILNKNSKQGKRPMKGLGHVTAVPRVVAAV